MIGKILIKTWYDIELVDYSMGPINSFIRYSNVILYCHYYNSIVSNIIRYLFQYRGLFCSQL